MGIPSYFSFIVKNHRDILKKTSKMKIHNLYLDSNSIIYDSYYNIIKQYEDDEGSYDFCFDIDTENFEKKLINSVILKINNYINIINPSNNVMIAFDGVAPVAKLNQQRNRRHKSSFEKEITNKINDSSEKWDKTAITPGTNFMNTLNTTISKYYETNKSKFKTKQIIFSGSDQCGEGEHKIFDYMRNNKKQHENETTFIYGLDADLIMLCLNHLYISPNIFLYRETPEFIKSIDKTLEPNQQYYIDIALLAEHIIYEMTDGYIGKNKNNYIHDYILMCFLLGNDFMPHFPALNIRTGGIHKLLSFYKNIFGKTKKSLYKDGTIQWGNVKKLIMELAVHELTFIKDEYNTRERMSKNTNKRYNKTILDRFNNMPLFKRDSEIYINPSEDGWEKRYYKTLFHIDINAKYKKRICINYIEGLEWNMKYYTQGCPNWEWYYKYSYPPLLNDLFPYIPSWDEEFITNIDQNPVSPFVQLAYVLPKKNLTLLPKKIRVKLLSQFKDYYETPFYVQWSFCRYFWESHYEFPPINISKINETIKTVNVIQKK